MVSVKSMMRYFPPNGTAGLALSSVSGLSLDPIPPAKITASASCIMFPFPYFTWLESNIQPEELANYSCFTSDVVECPLCLYNVVQDSSHRILSMKSMLFEGRCLSAALY
ncbi:hypothetical protein THOE12_10188 [Vibrio rotiferianus]|nr:hypothetical protein THOE12_10188 [Vibrio rotiferianus]